MRLLEKRTEIENETMKIYNTETAEYFCTAQTSTVQQSVIETVAGLRMGRAQSRGPERGGDLARPLPGIRQQQHKRGNRRLLCAAPLESHLGIWASFVSDFFQHIVLVARSSLLKLAANSVREDSTIY